VHVHLLKEIVRRLAQGASAADERTMEMRRRSLNKLAAKVPDEEAKRRDGAASVRSASFTTREAPAR
jgi:hypothetical protein